MSHARNQIRDAVVVLVTNLATTGTRVNESRMRPQESGSLPCLLVTTSDESITTNAIDGSLERLLRVEITGVVMSATPDTTLDNIAKEVETAIGANQKLGGLCEGMTLTSISTRFDDSLQQPVGEISLAFDCLYTTLAGAPGTTT